MKRFVESVLTIALPGVLAFGVAAFGLERQQESGTQTPPRSMHRGGPIPARLAAGDTDVTVVSGEWRGLAVGPAKGQSLIGFWLELGATAVVADLQQGAARLTAAQDFIETDWTAQVRDVLRIGPDHSFAQHRTIHFTVETGDLQISGVSVHARLGWARQFKAGARYLLFVYWDKDRSVPLVTPGKSYQILADGTLERVDLLQNEISKMTAKQAVEQIREWVRGGGHFQNRPGRP